MNDAKQTSILADRQRRAAGLGNCVGDGLQFMNGLFIRRRMFEHRINRTLAD
ncbi:hypothetical protein D3C72_2597400 [compost metagenome]